MHQLALNGLVIIEGRATYERIVSAIGNMDPDEALHRILDFIKIYPEFAQAHNDLAVLYYRTGNCLKSLAHYEKAHKLEPSNVTYRKNLADFYFVELEWTDDAIQTYLDILKDNPFDIEALNALGTISTRIGRREQARQYFTRTLQLDTVNSQASQALQQLGEQLPAAAATVAVQHPSTIQAQVTPLYQNSPKNPELPHGKTHEQTNNSNDAETRKALTVTTISNSVKDGLPSFNSDRSTETIYAEVQRFVEQEQLCEAQSLLEELVHHNDGNAMFHNDLGVLRYRLGDIDGARRAYERAVELQPSNINFCKNLADLYCVELEMVDDAIRIYLDLFRLHPRDLEVLVGLGKICAKVGQREEAKSFYRRALEVEPWNAEIRAEIQLLF